MKYIEVKTKGNNDCDECFLRIRVILQVAVLLAVIIMS